MRIITFRLLPWLTAFVVIGACAKEYSNEGNNTARFTLIGEGGDCTGALLSGKYLVDTGMTASNKVEVMARVTKKGNYSCTTPNVNGIQFSGSGKFADTGIQKIVLTATGKPTASGNFTYKITNGAGCTFSVGITKQLATIDFSCDNLVIDSKYFPGVPLDKYNVIEVKVNVASSGFYLFKTDTLDGISFADSGTFTKTGVQTILLKGNGTPDFARNLNFTVSNGTKTCSIPLTVTDPDPLAVYVLESNYGTPNPCTYTIAGNYQSGTPLTSANTVTINVYVAELGNFTIATSTLNGVMFAYSGTFTVKGTQTITLKGSGTPLSKGSVGFSPMIVGPHPLGGETCAFTIDFK